MLTCVYSMNLGLSDFNLVMSFCDTYNLSSLDADFTVWANSIRYVYTNLKRGEQRNYIKDLKWSRNNCHNRAWLFERLALRICLNKRVDHLTYEDMSSIGRAIKEKHGISHCHHSCYTITHLFRSVTCECCGCGYYISQWYSSAEQGKSICSKECAVIARLCSKLLIKHKHNLISQRFFRSKGDSKLHKFLNYLTSQGEMKRKRKNKGKFTWS